MNPAFTTQPLPGGPSPAGALGLHRATSTPPTLGADLAPSLLSRIHLRSPPPRAWVTAAAEKGGEVLPLPRSCWLTILKLTCWVRGTHSLSLQRESDRAHHLVELIQTDTGLQVLLFLSPAHNHPGGNPGANLRSISHRCCLREVAFEWELTKETIYSPLGCLQGGNEVKHFACFGFPFLGDFVRTSICDNSGPNEN